jgi:hypothetical protein
MKNSILFAGALMLLTVPCLGIAHADVQQDRQGIPDRYQEGNGNYNASNQQQNDARVNNNFDPVAYNNDVPGRNRGEYSTGSNMGPGGRNSGFDDNSALHSSSSRHINDDGITYANHHWW